MIHPKKLIGLLFASPLILADPAPEAAQVNLHLRNYFEDYRPAGATPSQLDGHPLQAPRPRTAWAQGLMVNGVSPLWSQQGWGLRLGGSLYGALKLSGDEDRWGTGLLKEDFPVYNPRRQRLLADQSSYGKIGQAYVEGHWRGNDPAVPSTMIRAGWLRIERGAIQTFEKTTPTSFRGVLTEVQKNDVTLYGAWADRVSKFNWSEYERFSSSRRGHGGHTGLLEPVSAIYTLGLALQPDTGLFGELSYGASTDFLRRTSATLGCGWPLAPDNRLTLRGQWHRTEGNGDLWKDDGKTLRTFDDRAQLLGLDLLWQLGDWSLSLAYSQIKAAKNNGLGWFPHNLTADDTAPAPQVTARQVSDFNHHGEQVWQAGIGYRFDRLVPGLSLTYTATAGRNIEALDDQGHKLGDRLEETEQDIELAYAVSKLPQGQQLTLTLKYGYYQADRALRAYHVPLEGYSDRGASDWRVTVDYQLGVF